MIAYLFDHFSQCIFMARRSILCRELVTWRGRVREESYKGEQEKVSWYPEKPFWLCHQRQLDEDMFSKQLAKFPVGCRWHPPIELMALGSGPGAYFGTSCGGSFLLLWSVVWIVKLLRILSLKINVCWHKLSFSGFLDNPLFLHHC